MSGSALVLGMGVTDAGFGVSGLVGSTFSAPAPLSGGRLACTGLAGFGCPCPTGGSFTGFVGLTGFDVAGSGFA